jgi:hypothetical protein
MVAPADDATSTAREFSSEVAHEPKQLTRLGANSLPVAWIRLGRAGRWAALWVAPSALRLG